MAVKSESERGLWGAWARRERLSRDWTVDEVVQRVAAEAHVRMDVATLRGIEGGSKKPSVRLQDALALVFGSRPQAVPQPATTADAVLEAIRLQTEELRNLWISQQEQNAINRELVAALTDLVRETHLSRAEGEGRGVGFERILARIEAAVTPASNPDEPARQPRLAQQ